jgi:hypothetical protein
MILRGVIRDDGRGQRRQKLVLGGRIRQRSLDTRVLRLEVAGHMWSSTAGQAVLQQGEEQPPSDHYRDRRDQ